MEELKYQLLREVYKQRLEIIDSIVKCCQSNGDPQHKQHLEYLLGCSYKLEHSIMETKIEEHDS